MICNINYLKMKKAILKYFRNENIFIEIKGIINTRFCIDKSRIIINKHKLIISNEEVDCIILLDFIKRAKVDRGQRIELIGLESQYILEI